jgi:5'-3' exonuclease
MGIPYFVASIARTNRGLIRPVRGQLKTDVLLIDLNCFLHRYLDDSDPYPSIVKAIADLMELVSATIVVACLDGMAPYAKQVQQRYRRMRKSEPGVFDRHQLSPETPWMRGLLEHLPSSWIVSGTDQPGEGEHKIFKWLRANPQKTGIIYGLDADLVLLALANSNLCKLQLLREKNEFHNILSKDAEWGLLDIGELSRNLPVPVEQFLEIAVTCWGNDFLPPIAMFSLREDGYARALQYKGVCKEAANIEHQFLTKRIIQRARPDEQALLGNLEERMAIQLFDGVQDWKPVVDAYWKTVNWTLHYFRTNEVLDWTWYYPYPEAPLVSTLMKYPRPKISWPMGPIPFHVGNQLQFILPQVALRRAKRRVLFPDEIYDEETEVRVPFMRRHNWEARPRISLPWHPTISETEVAPL